MDGYSLQVLDTSDPINRRDLLSPLCVHRLNEIESACQAIEPTENVEDGVAFSILKEDFLARPFLYKSAYVFVSKAVAHSDQSAVVYPTWADSESPSDHEVMRGGAKLTLAASGQFNSIQCAGLKDTWFQGNIERVAFVFLTRTHPDARWLGSSMVSTSLDLSKLKLVRLFGYIHEDKLASISLLRKLQCLCLGHHRIFLLSAEPTTLPKPRVSGASLRALSVDEADACYSSPLTYGCRDFSLANFKEILDHPNHRGTFVLQGREGTLGGSVWDMSGLGSLVLRGQPQHTPGHGDDRSMQRYVLLHNMFFLPRSSSPTETPTDMIDSEHFASLKLARARMLPEFVALMLAHCSSTLGVAYVVVDDDGRDDALVRTLRSQFAVVGETSEYINNVFNFWDVAVDCQHWTDAPKRAGRSYPVGEKTGRVCSCALHSATADQPPPPGSRTNFGGQQQFLDPRDFSTLLSFKQCSRIIMPQQQDGSTAHL